MIVWTHAILGVLSACVLYSCICTCSANVSMFRVGRCSRNMPIIITVIYYYSKKTGGLKVNSNVSCVFVVWFQGCLLPANCKL